jgi:hypothetical protein
MHQPVSLVANETLRQLEKAAYPVADPDPSTADTDSKKPVLAVPKELW